MTDIVSTDLSLLDSLVGILLRVGDVLLEFRRRFNNDNFGLRLIVDAQLQNVRARVRLSIQSPRCCCYLGLLFLVSVDGRLREGGGGRDPCSAECSRRQLLYFI